MYNFCSIFEYKQTSIRWCLTGKYHLSQPFNNSYQGRLKSFLCGSEWPCDRLENSLGCTPPLSNGIGSSISVAGPEQPINWCSESRKSKLDWKFLCISDSLSVCQPTSALSVDLQAHTDDFPRKTGGGAFLIPGNAVPGCYSQQVTEQRWLEDSQSAEEQEIILIIGINLWISF